MKDIVEHCNWWYEQTGAPTYKLAAEALEAKNKCIAELERKLQTKSDARDFFKASVEELESDNERLREGLEEIATKPPPDDAYELRMMARKLLEEKDNG